MLQAKRNWRFTLGRLFLVVLFTLGIITSGSVSAQQSELTQEIAAPDCRASRDCPLQRPTITSIDKNGGRPIISGTFDAAYTKSLVVIFGGVVYILGSSSELTAQRGEWRLDLSTLSSPLIPGEYEFVIEATGYDDQKAEARAIIAILPSEVEVDNTKPDENPAQTDGSPSTPIPKPIAVVKPSLAPLGIVLGSTIGVAAVYAAAMRRKRH